MARAATALGGGGQLMPGQDHGATLPDDRPSPRGRCILRNPTMPGRAAAGTDMTGVIQRGSPGGLPDPRRSAGTWVRRRTPTPSNRPTPISPRSGPHLFRRVLPDHSWSTSRPSISARFRRVLPRPRVPARRHRAEPRVAVQAPPSNELTQNPGIPTAAPRRAPPIGAHDSAVTSTPIIMAEASQRTFAAAWRHPPGQARTA